MESKENYLRRLLVAGVGAAELGYEKLGEIIDECVKRGEVTVERGRALNEELKHRCAKPEEKKPSLDPSALTAEERATLLEKLLAMQEEAK